MGITAGRSQDIVVACTMLDGSAEVAAGTQAKGRGPHDGLQIADIDQHVRRDHQIPRSRRSGDPLYQIRHRQMIVNAPPSRLLDHARGQIRTMKTASQGAERHPREPGAAADIQNVEAAIRDAGKPVGNGAKGLWRLILQPDRQILIEPVGVAVEQRPDIGLRHRFGRIALDAADQCLHGVRIVRAGVQASVQSVGGFLPLAQVEPGPSERQQTLG